MKKRVLCLILTLVMIFALVPSAAAASDEATEAAEALYELGLFKGTGTNPDGTPIFDLDKTPTRNQAIIMLVRLLGKEEEAKAGTWNIPFTDVSDSMKPYIGYAYTNGLTNGYTATTYCGGNPIRANQYIAFVLRALGYVSGKDFQVSTSWKLADELGITHGEYANATSFTRGDVAKISLKAHKIQEATAKFTERQYADEELQAFVDENLSFRDACDKLSTISDVVRYLYLRGYHFEPDNAGVEASTRYRLNSGACVGGSALLNALLEGDYDEQGYVYIFYARGEHVFDYFVKDGVYFYCDLVPLFHDSGTYPQRDPVCHITTDPSTLYDAWLQLEPHDLNDSSSDMYLAAMYTTAYCGNPTMPAIWLRDSSTGKYSRIPLSPAEKKSQQILFLRDGYTFEF
ncbi:S-layer homology domain-containing protein [Oscillibacter sp.]|uniref:S-layer homology domain-containing protein n=1 Tax=Oscillibacter sp. TaxID=1945593 RepID=UPI001B61D386|nr:S-layer homology domain-containing protein [Oscillibacter sp.]MBP3508495.1 S-layer homology domain-containing protein [Oscillibacter sp.]